MYYWMRYSDHLMNSTLRSPKLLGKLTKAMLIGATAICGSVNATVGDRIADDSMPPDSSGPCAGMRLSSGSCAAAVACPTARWHADRAEPPSGSSSANLSSEANGESLTVGEEHFKSRTSFGAGSFALGALGFAASRINW